MSSLVSRVLVGIIGLPLVLGMLWLGGWWLFALLVVAGVIALHELALLARSVLRDFHRHVSGSEALPLRVAGRRARDRDRARRGRRRPVRVGAEARHGGEGHGPRARRPRGDARPSGFDAVRGARGVLADQGVRLH